MGCPKNPLQYSVPSAISGVDSEKQKKWLKEKQGQLI